MAKEKLKAKKKKRDELRPEERSKGVEGKKTAKNTVMDTGLCYDLSRGMVFSCYILVL